MISCLISLNVVLVVGVKSIFSPFFNMSFSGLTISANWVMNFLMKLIFPKYDFNSSWLAGNPIFDSSSIYLGSIEIPHSDITCPWNFPIVTTNMHFFGFKKIPYLLHLWKILFKSWIWSSLCWENTMRSSMYMMMHFLTKSLKEYSMALWKVAPTLIKPKNILL